MPNQIPSPEPESRYFVRSIARASEILEMLSHRVQGDGMSVTEISQGCGLSKSATFAILYTLQHLGLVADDGEGMNRRYRLGMALVRLGSRAQDQVSLRQVARPRLVRLTTETAFASRLAIPDQGHAVVIDQISSNEQVTVALRMGMRELPHCTGLGKALLSTMTADEVIAVTTRVGMTARTKHTMTTTDQLLANLQQARRVGYALDDEEDADGIFCIGSPVLAHGGACIGAISITGLKPKQASHRYRELGKLVKHAADDISRTMGYTGTVDND